MFEWFAAAFVKCDEEFLRETTWSSGMRLGGICGKSIGGTRAEERATAKTVWVLGYEWFLARSVA